MYAKRGDGIIHAFSNADWGQERSFGKSNGGICFTLSNGPFRWRSKQQSIVAQSSKKAKYIALSFCEKEALCPKKFARSFNGVLLNEDLSNMFDILIGEDSIGCVQMLRNMFYRNTQRMST